MNDTKDLNDKLFYAEVVLRSRPVVPKTADSKLPKVYKDNSLIVNKVKDWLISRDFIVTASSPFGLSIVGPRALFQKYFHTDIVRNVVKVALSKERTRREMQFEFAKDNPPQIPEELVNEIEAVYIPPRGRYLSPMPNPNYYHLSLPDDISRITNADGAHSRGFRGAGVKVAMVDSGLVVTHEYFNNRGYKMTVHCDNTDNATKDECGHGTAMAANLLAIAPECDFHLFKVNPNIYPAPYLAAFRNAYAEPNVRVISCSWSLDQFDQLWDDEIASVIAMGIIVVFACGNKDSCEFNPIGDPQYQYMQNHGGCPPVFPSCMSDLICVGGVYPNSDGILEASDYASSGVNPCYPTSPAHLSRQCPDICGVCGQDENLYGRLIVMPTPPGSELDSNASLIDKTLANDGWLVASGTSAAAAQVAGGAAVVLSAKPTLTNGDVKQVLMDTGTDVTNGASATGESAGPGIDNATGHGLINLNAAVDKVNPPGSTSTTSGTLETWQKHTQHKTTKKRKKKIPKIVIRGKRTSGVRTRA